jgi:hypothetical protein
MLQLKRNNSKIILKSQKSLKLEQVDNYSKKLADKIKD